MYGGLIDTGPKDIIKVGSFYICYTEKHIFEDLTRQSILITQETQQNLVTQPS